MSKTLTKHEVNLKKFRRINDKSLRQHLIHRFINSYGYDKGEVTAQAIVDDILKTVERYFVLNSSAVGGPTGEKATGADGTRETSAR